MPSKMPPFDPGTDPETMQLAIKHDHATRQIRMIAIAAVIVLLVLISGITYCGGRSGDMNQEQEAVRRAETQRITACVQAGGSWVPVRKSGYTDSEMSCVTAVTLPMVKEMNTKKD